jgi:multiple antibiotic resistance protein
MNQPMPLAYLVSAVVTLFVVVDPVGLAPAFMATTAGLPKAARRQVAQRAALIAGCILAGTALIGDWLLHQLGITLPAFRIAGGLLLFSIASEMVFGVRVERQARTAEQAIEERVRNIAAFPLATPLLAGPGAITATILLAGQAGTAPLYLAILIGVIAAVAALCLLTFLVASRIERALGVTGTLLLSRLLGVLLAALAVQFVIDGVRALLPG